jgi:hypothetical protein
VTALAIINGIAVVLLALLTGYYAWQTHSMAEEMRRARLLTFLPKLALDLAMATPTYAMVVVRNVGSGPALDADLRLVFAGTDSTEPEERSWLAHVVAPGERHEFIPPTEVNSLIDLAARHPTVSLRGSVRDALGQAHAVSEQIDVAEASARLESALHRWEETPQRKMVRELEKLGPELHKIELDLSALATVAQNWWRAQSEDDPPNPDE